MRSAADSTRRRIGSSPQTGESRGAVDSATPPRVFSHRRFRCTLYLPWRFNLVAFTSLFVILLLLLLRLAWVE